MTDPSDPHVPAHDVTLLRTVAEELAAEAADFVRTRRAEVFGATPVRGAVQTKSTPTDPVTVVDTETEALLRERLAQRRPDDAVLGEEGGGPARHATAGAVTWVLDPIDGTVNFVYGIPAYAVSVAAQIDGVSVAGAVADVARGEIYSAAVGSGAHVLGPHGRTTLRCAETTELGMALVATGFSYCAQRRAVQARLLSQLLPTVRDVRRIGSAAIDLCLVAAGRLDGYYEHGLQVWDWAAGALIAAEAGATVHLPDGRSGALIMASAPGIAEALTAELTRLDGMAPLPG